MCCSLTVVSLKRSELARTIDHITENHGVGGSIPPLGTISLSRPRVVVSGSMTSRAPYSLPVAANDFRRRLAPSAIDVAIFSGKPFGSALKT